MGDCDFIQPSFSRLPSKRNQLSVFSHSLIKSTSEISSSKENLGDGYLYRWMREDKLRSTMTFEQFNVILLSNRPLAEIHPKWHILIHNYSNIAAVSTSVFTDGSAFVLASIKCRCTHFSLGIAFYCNIYRKKEETKTTTTHTQHTPYHQSTPKFTSTTPPTTLITLTTTIPLVPIVTTPGASIP
jgi:hypothetical protein